MEKFCILYGPTNSSFMFDFYTNCVVVTHKYTYGTYTFFIPYYFYHDFLVVVFQLLQFFDSVHVISNRGGIHELII